MAGAVEVRAFQVTCNPGVSAANPQITALAMPVRDVHNIRVRVPPGPNGFMGFAIGSAGNNVIPINAGAFIVASDEIIDWSLADQIDSGAWQAIMYNTGRFPHTIYVLFTVELPDVAPAGTGVTPVIIAPTAPTLPAAPSAPSDALPPPPVLT